MKRISREYENCQRCEGLRECQYAKIGNRGFRPIWGAWSPIYSYVEECEHKRAQSTRARIERLFGNSGIPVEYKETRLRDIKRPTPALMALLQLTNGKVRGVYVYGKRGKTEIVSAAGNELILQGVDTLYTTARSMYTQLRANNPEYYKKQELLTRVPALIIENVKETYKYNEEQLEGVLEERERQGLRVIVSGEEKIENLGVGEGVKKRLKQLREGQV